MRPVLACVLFVLLSHTAAWGHAALPDGAPSPNGKAEEGATAASKQGVTKEAAAVTGSQGGSASPTETAKSTEKGTLKNPYSDYETVAPEGRKIWLSAGCNGCHGMGGGGMGPPLTNQVWVYGKDDDTLFRLIALGSDALQRQGYKRKGSENVVGPMPPMGNIVKSTDDLWKIIAWIRSINPSSVEASSGSAAP